MCKGYYKKQEAASSPKPSAQPASPQSNHPHQQTDKTNALKTQLDSSTDDKTMTAPDPKDTQQKEAPLPVYASNATTINDGGTKHSTGAPTEVANTLPDSPPMPPETTVKHLHGVPKNEEALVNNPQHFTKTSVNG